MKKFILFIVLAVTLFTLVSCSNENIENSTEIKNYEIGNSKDEIITSFDILDDSIHCSVFYKDNEEEYNTKICIYDEKGQNVQEHYLDETNMPLNLVCTEQNLYYYTVPQLTENAEEKYVIKQYNAENKIDNQIFAFENCLMVNKLESYSSYLLALISESGIENADKKKLIIIDLQKYESSVILSDNIIDFSISKNGDIIILTRDTNGYVFTRYDISNNVLTEKTYKDFENVDGICFYDDKKFIAYGYNIPSGAAIYSINEAGNIPVLDHTIQLSGECKLNNGKFYCLTTDGIHIADVSDALEQRLDNSISMITSGNYLEAQQVTGFNTKQEIVDDEKFSLTVLSNDPQYDIFYLRSRAHCAAEIRDKGAFYPLNNVEGVEEYIDACFPFIKEAATNEEGEIWMIPIIVQPCYIVYNEEICHNNGLSLYDGMSAEDFVDMIIKYYSEGHTDYDIFGTYIYVEQLLSDYILKYNRFDTPEFRDLAVLIKDKIYNNVDAFQFGNHMTEMYEMNLKADRTNQSFALCFNSSNINIYERDWGNKAKAMRVPLFTDSGISISTSVFICVNPFSSNLDKTLEYISALCKKLVEQGSEDNDSINRDKVMMLQDSPVYSRNEFFSNLHDIYNTGVMRFTYPAEIYEDDFDRYINGEISLDDFITEADRKFKVYLNE